MTVKRVLVDNNNMATFVCPECKFSKDADVSKYIGKAVSKKHLYKCKKCGHAFAVLLERRKYIRMDVNIPGSYVLDEEVVKRPMTVVDLSRSGVKIELEEEVTLKPGDRLFVKFRLDNKQKTMIKKEVIVRSVSGLKIGTEFCSRDPKNPVDRAYDVAIGYYTYPRA
ncbi:MAG: PilZ domain-containing protein [Desulfobacterales bacterium]|nr:PilZ domain-containing protein [Desulfobacterales bacterium]